MDNTIILAIALGCIFTGACLGLRAAADASIKKATDDAIDAAAREDNRLRAEAAAKAFDEMELSRIFADDAFGVQPVNDTTAQPECCLANMGRADGTEGTILTARTKPVAAILPRVVTGFGGTLMAARNLV